MTRRRVSETLISKAARSVARHAASALRRRGKAGSRGRGSARDLCVTAGRGVGRQHRVVIRHFACPDCAALLDSETALPKIRSLKTSLSREPE